MVSSINLVVSRISRRRVFLSTQDSFWGSYRYVDAMITGSPNISSQLPFLPEVATNCLYTLSSYAHGVACLDGS